MQVVVYSRPGCHLCEEAVALLAEYGICSRIVNIDADPGLLAQYDTWVPVIEIDGKVRFRGRIERRLFERFLAGDL
jgi:glutaredoxin